MITNRFYGYQPLSRSSLPQFGMIENSSPAKKNFGDAIRQGDLPQARNLLATKINESGSDKRGRIKVMVETILEHVDTWAPEELDNAINVIKDVEMIAPTGYKIVEAVILRVMGALVNGIVLSAEASGELSRSNEELRRHDFQIIQALAKRLDVGLGQKA
jgi:hypothetical protein